METNDKYIRFTGKANIPDELKMGEAYQVWIDGEITAITESNNQDGTKAVYYKLVPVRAEIKNQFGKVIKAKDTRSMSQKMRALIKWKWESSNNDPRDVETAYEETMKELMKFIDTAYNKAKPKVEKKDYPEMSGEVKF